MGPWSRTRDEYGRFTGTPEGFRPTPLDERTHGIISTYRAGCKCDQCRAAAASARRRAPSRARERER